ncbi:MAG: type II toxin-antitoxin system HicB family antitoxin [Candidatus Dormibacteria bacterium]
MKYKGYTGIVEFDEESGSLFGRVVGLRDLITFQGDSVTEMIQAFHDSVDVYLELCADRGESPEKPYSGQFVLRIDPHLHRAVAHAAEERGLSLNSLIEENLRTAFVREGLSTSGAETVPGRAARSATPGKKKVSARQRRPIDATERATSPETGPKAKAPGKHGPARSGRR